MREGAGAANTTGWPENVRDCLWERKKNRVSAFGGECAGISRSGATSTVRTAPLPDLAWEFQWEFQKKCH
jgi:hypothetical protein